MSTVQSFELSSCRQLLELYPESRSILPAVEVIERTIFQEPGIAFTHCRGLLETVCISILADRGQEIPPESKPNWLMTQALATLELTSRNAEDKDAERGVSSVLKGLNLLVDGIVALRNSQGIGPHGRDALEKMLSVEYALLTARAMDAAVGLMFRLHREQLNRNPMSQLRYGAHPDFDEYLDERYADIVIEEVPIQASVALYQQDRRAYQKSLVDFRAGQAETSDITEGQVLHENSNG
ncbi:abortive infection family protein [Massilia timonae]|uniref:Abortive infection protein-like C-terminal domain-containing protein n=1 Tax=Massilia timonae CCUG 45783 TaxID=883126 RepID=K9DSF9_9BURK|nr:abortive infection family protein [Massilia timonae]EKU81667.1 hypothetical protein HMPREF9710_03022 [Massilia timonae CCUG 45783]